VLVAGYGATKTSAFQWFLLRASLRSQFPQVQWITTRELADWQEDRQRQQPMLLDVRTQEEWNVSHLPNARRIEPGASAEAVASDISKDTPIVTYCAVGYRSAQVAKRLRATGFTQVQSLDGGIFEWANEHRPLVRDGERETRVHPYNQFWARLLKDEVRGPL
jgi:rhodanese-related sulfurtransferase